MATLRKRDMEAARKYSKEYYYAHLEKERAYSRKWQSENKGKRKETRDRNAEKNRQIIRSLKDVPCKDCGHTFHHSAMTFDHLPMYNKCFDIGNDVRRKTETILAEVRKCEVVCANCHNVRTWTRRQNA